MMKKNVALFFRDMETPSSTASNAGGCKSLLLIFSKQSKCLITLAEGLDKVEEISTQVA